MSITRREAGSELARKLVHVGFGLVVLVLPYLSWGEGLALALAALVHNRFILPLWGRAIARRDVGHDPGILIYPAVVFALLLVFRHDEWIAAACWALLAFGDGFATIAGRILRSAALPWTHDKSVAGLLAHLAVGIPAAMLAAWWCGAASREPAWMAIVFAGGVVAALVETLRIGLDDNFTQTAAAAAVMAYGAALTRYPPMLVDQVSAGWLIANLVLALVGYVARSVTVSGALAGALLGSALILWGGWPAYVVLLMFFIIGSGLTRMGWEEKRTIGVEQEDQGRRGMSHAFANVGAPVALLLVAVTTDVSAGLMWLAFVAAFATAAADTTGSEVGQWLGRRAFLPLTLRPVPRGTEGAVSIEGTLAGVASALVVSSAGMGLLAFKGAAFDTLSVSEGWSRVQAGAATGAFWQGVGIIAASAIFAAYIESIAGSFNRNRDEPVPNGILNFMNTVAGATLAVLFAILTGYAI